MGRNIAFLFVRVVRQRSHDPNGEYFGALEHLCGATYPQTGVPVWLMFPSITVPLRTYEAHILVLHTLLFHAPGERRESSATQLSCRWYFCTRSGGQFLCQSHLNNYMPFSELGQSVCKCSRLKSSATFQPNDYHTLELELKSSRGLPT